MPGTYKLVRRGSNKCLDVNANANGDGVVIHQWECNGTGAQSFRFESVSASAYRIVKEGTNYCVDVAAAGTANGTKVQLWTCNGTGAQSFRVDDRGDGTARLVNTNSNKCVEVRSGAGDNGAVIQIQSCGNADAQRWTITRVGGNNPQPTWRTANLTNYESYPDPGSDECERFNGCQWAGYFAFVDGRQTEDWVRAHNIIAVHSDDAPQYALKTLRLRQNGRTIDATVYDMCSDDDCDGCCSQNSSQTGFLIDIEKYTMQRFGSGDGIVEWICLDCN